MGDIFFKVLNMSITAGWLVLVVLAVRLLFRRMPKWVCCLLWGIVAVRLLVPFSIESPFSLQPSAQPIQATAIVNGELKSYLPSIDSRLSFVENRVNPALQDTFAYQEAASATPLQIVTEIAGVIWLAGMILLVIFAVVSAIRLHLLVREAICYRENSYLCDAVTTPFILGVLRPRIYLPSTLTEGELDYILAHENAHLKRGDHVWKTIGYLMLCVYWFNPLCWIAYLMLCKDIELACDEKVIRDMSFDDKKEYSRVLLSCATQRRFVLRCPLAFGEVGVKERVKMVLNHKKCAFGITVLAVVVCVIVAVCFLTNPVGAPSDEATEVTEVTSSAAPADKTETTDSTASEINGTQTGRNAEVMEVTDETAVMDELTRVVSTVGLENAYPWDNTADLKQNADALIKMAADDSGRYEIYGIMSKKYGTYGMLLNDWVGGSENWNFACVPWYYSGAPDEEPVLKWDSSGADKYTFDKYVFSYVSAYENGAPVWCETVLDCGYDTGHMEFMSEEASDERLRWLGDVAEEMVYIGWLRGKSCAFDPVEWVEVPGERADELGITEEDAPSGFYVYNESIDFDKRPVDDNCRFQVLDWENNYEPKNVTKEEMEQILEERKDLDIPYKIRIDNNYITAVTEQYIP